MVIKSITILNFKETWLFFGQIVSKFILFELATTFGDSSRITSVYFFVFIDIYIF